MRRLSAPSAGKDHRNVVIPLAVTIRGHVVDVECDGCAILHVAESVRAECLLATVDGSDGVSGWAARVA
eukprot:7148138-Prymnesium_polylepis.1